MPLWIEFLQSWCKIRGHAQSHARWLVRCLWLNGDKVKQHKGRFAILTRRPLTGCKYVILLDGKQRPFQYPFVNKKSKLLGRNRTNTSAYHCFLGLRLEQSLLAAHANGKGRACMEWGRDRGREGWGERAHTSELWGDEVCAPEESQLY